MPFSGLHANADFTNPASDLTDYVALVDLSDLPQSWWDEVDTSDATKGRAAKDDGTTELATDWQEFDDVAQTGFVWVRWSGTLSSTGTNTIRIYPPKSGNSSYASTATYGSEAVWVNYTAVYHLEEDPTGTAPQFADATGNGNDMTSQGIDANQLVSAKFGNGLEFDGGSNEYAEDSDFNSLGGTTNRTVSFWINSDSVSSKQHAVSLGAGVVDGDRFDVGVNSSVLYFETAGSGISATTTLSDNTYYLIHIALDGTTMNDLVAYLNGSSETLGSNSTTFQVKDGLRVGISSGGLNSRVDGVVDEVRLTANVLPSDWVSLEYQNQNDPATFWGTWTTAGGGGGTTISANDLSTSHSLDQATFQTIALSGNELESSNSLDQGSIPITLSGDELSNSNSLDQGSIQIVLDGNELTTSNTLEQGQIPVVLSANALSTSNTLEQGGFSDNLLIADDLTTSHNLDQGRFVTFTLSADDLQTSNILEGGQLAIVLSGADLQSSQNLDRGSLQTITLSGSDLQSSNILAQGSLIVVGEAMKVSLEAKELYTITLQAKKLYNIELNDKEQYIITLNANEVIE